jgi:hypothetical protein
MQFLFSVTVGKNKKIYHVVFASHKSIAMWYAKNNPFMRVYVPEKGYEQAKFERVLVGNFNEHTLAHAADKALQQSYENWVANGGSIEYARKLRRLVSLIEKKEDLE